MLETHCVETHIVLTLLITWLVCLTKPFPSPSVPHIGCPSGLALLLAALLLDLDTLPKHRRSQNSLFELDLNDLESLEKARESTVEKVVLCYRERVLCYAIQSKWKANCKSKVTAFVLQM